jgi:outer membrane protein assembly factor BamB
MKRTSFVCFGIQGNKDALVYQEIPARDSGEEFFLFFSPGEPGQEASLRSLFRDAVSTSRLGVATNYFQRFIERFGETMGALDEADDPLRGAVVMVEIRRGGEVYLLCNRGAAVVHWEGPTGGFAPIDSLDHIEEIPIRTSGDQRDLFRLAPEDSFVLYHFILGHGSHTLIGAPSRDFIVRSEERLRDSILFPAFEIPAEMGIELGTTRSFPVLHWKRGEVPERTAIPAAVAVVRRPAVAIAVGLVVITAAVMLVPRLRPFVREKSSPVGADRSVLFAADDAATVDEAAPPRVTGTASVPAVRAVRSLGEAWKRQFRAAVTSSPRCCGERILFGCRDGFIYAYARDGSSMWKYASGAGIGASPVCTEDRVICANYRGTVFCLNTANGSTIWSVETRSRIVSAPRVWQDQVIAGTTDGRLLAVSLKDGKKNWEKKIGPSVWADAAVGGEFVVVATTDGTVLRIDRRGRIVWRTTVGGGVYSNPLCLEAQDLVVFGSNNSFVYAFSLSNGALRWKYRAGGEVGGSPAVRGNTIYIGAKDRNVYALSTEGKLLWKRDVGGAILSIPLVMGDTVLFTTYGAKLVALDADTGSLVAEFGAGSPIYSSPASDGKRVYFGSNGGVFYAVDLPREPS